MRGLLEKDFYVLSRQMRVFLLMTLVFAVLPGTNMAMFAVIYAAMMPYTALAYDERSHWDQLAATMPYTVTELVVSKYVLGWLFTTGTAAVALAASLVERRFTDAVASPMTIFLSLCVGLAMIALTLPPMFRFGVERGRMFFILFMVVVACGGVGLVNGLVQAPEAKSLTALLSVALPAAAVVLSAVSIPLSVRFYRVRMR